MTVSRLGNHEGEVRHDSVLLFESVEALVWQPNGFYVDATFGRGGHARAILSQLSASGQLLALDRDPEAVAAATALGTDPRFAIENARFSQLGEILSRRAVQSVDGVLLDLGASAPQLLSPERGFSFQHDGTLDMRMDPSCGLSVTTWLAKATEAEIARVLRDYGEERRARRIAAAIVASRRREPLSRTKQLASLVAGATGGNTAGHHPATRSFQALRIHINEELEELAAVLKQLPALLAPGGRLVCLSFHSLEDRIVKRFLRTEAGLEPPPPGLPPPVRPAPRLRQLARLRPTAEECSRNPRSRSAIMRIAERLP